MIRRAPRLDGDKPLTDTNQLQSIISVTEAPQGTGTVRAFLDQHFCHFNSREVVDATRAYERHIEQGGRMLVTLAGAMSTAKIGQSLARLIRAGYVHAICCTGANLEEDIFNLLAAEEYELCPDWRGL